MTSSTGQQVCRRFSLGEIQLATGDFSDAHVIGKGGFGKVYKGLIDDGSLIVAVKRLASNSKQGEREFVTEMETLSKLRHRNLVSLIGYCNEEGEMILVYEYMPHGTLGDHLHKNNDHASSLSWNERLRICIGAGRGLDYLHTGSSIIHRDVKPTNILLDENYTAKVSDFGLAKHLSVDNLESHVSTIVKGSFGYFDPSYFTSGRLTKASDTYAFGVVLLEVLSGRPAIDGKLAEGELCLTMWAQDKIRNGKFQQIVASTLRAEISDDCLKTFVGVVKRCLHHEPKNRGSMSRAVAQLEDALEQQERKGETRKLQSWAFWKRVIPSGETQKDNNEVEVKMVGEDTRECKESVDSVDELEKKQNVREQIGVPAAFQLADIKDITHDFGSNRRIAWIGVGTTGGSKFRGVLKSGQHVSIKRCNMNLPNQEFVEQVSLLSRVKHENVMELVGYCVDGGVQLLVYEFPTRGSLHDILHGRQAPTGLALEPGPALSWAQRVDIAVGAAKGLLCFHENSLIHRNIKSNNVLLFDHEIAKITDSHLSDCPCERESIFYDTPVPLCHNHPPEFPRFSQKGDVYSFGVVLLELLTGSTSSITAREIVDLVTWATPMLGEHNVHNIVDATLKGDYPHKAVASMAAVAALCVQRDADSRPNMDIVLKSLHGIQRGNTRLPPEIFTAATTTRVIAPPNRRILAS